MATVIDSLIVALNLDPKNFKKGAADANKAIKDTEATVNKSAGAMASALHRTVTEFIGLFIAVRSVQDVIGFFEKVSASTRQLGLDSKNLGIAANELQNWNNIAELAGGSADEATKTIKGLQHAIFAMQHGEGMPEQLKYLYMLGVQAIDTTNKMVPFKNILMQAAAIMERNGRPREENAQFLQAAGFGPGLTNAILDGSAALKKYLADQEELRQVTKAQTDAADRMEKAWGYLKDRIGSVAREIVTSAEPSIMKLFAALGKGVDWINAHQDDINAWLAKITDWAVTGGASALKSFFVDLATDVSTVANAIRDIAAAIDALNQAGENIGGAVFKALHERAQTDRHGNRVGGQVNAGQYAPAITSAEQKYGLPEGLLARVAKQESGFNPNAVSSAGARGIMQLLPRYFPKAGQDAGNDIDTAAQYLASLHQKYGNWADAVAAYNAGPGTIDAVRAGTKRLPAETTNYVRNVWDPIAGAPSSTPGSGSSSTWDTARAMFAPNPSAIEAALAAQRAAQPAPTPAPAAREPPIASSKGSSNGVQIDSITVNTQAVDAYQMAADLQRALQRKLLVAQAEPGLA